MLHPGCGRSRCSNSTSTLSSVVTRPALMWTSTARSIDRHRADQNHRRSAGMGRTGGVRPRRPHARRAGPVLPAHRGAAGGEARTGARSSRGDDVALHGEIRLAAVRHLSEAARHVHRWATAAGGERGAPGEIRTPDRLIRSQMLYPLSYGRVVGKYGIPSGNGELRTDPTSVAIACGCKARFRCGLTTPSASGARDRVPSSVTIRRSVGGR